MAAVYADWRARGAEFLTPPKEHEYETRCYMRDPDGYLIEVGQTTDPKRGLGTRSVAGDRRSPRDCGDLVIAVAWSRAVGVVSDKVRTPPREVWL